ncbi:hypothetical protein BJ508DRAFT_313877 [Ascobolus immersus RN42]|uniref:CCHC-type domain-containing protein n=1 Tax=Ascobolus immersus RN42 TaxID=1160509 RepID=A0A3N4HJ96_ASCIM|nr:hypothetical protein BJ508DRAFT_313877 [Ascobolus immersus RN42]
MDLNAATRRDTKGGKEFNKLSDEEKEARFKKGQCFYCKGVGHYVSACPVAKAKGHKQGSWRKPNDNRKAYAASALEGTRGVEKGKVVYTLGGADGAARESKN